MQILLADPNLPHDAWRLKVGEDAKIWFFGKSYQQLAELRLAAQGVTFASTDHLDDVADELADELANLEEKLFLSLTPEWWDATNTAERSPYTSNLTLNAVRLVLLNRSLGAAKSHLVLTDDAGLWRAIERLARTRGYRLVRLPAKLSFRNKLGRLRTHIKKWLGAHIQTPWQLYGKWRLLKSLRRKASKKAPDIHPGSTLLLSWCGPKDILGDGTWNQDVMHGNIPAVLRQAGHDLRIMALPADWIVPFKVIAAKLLEAPEPVLLPYDLLRPLDFLKAALQSLNIYLPHGAQAQLDQVDITPLIHASLQEDRISSRLPFMLLFTAIGERLGNNKPRMVILPYEHQSWERRLIRRVHKAGIPVLGHQHSPFPLSLASAYPNQHERTRRAMPDRLLLQGEWERRQQIRHGADPNELFVIGSWRFSEALSTEPLPSHTAGPVLVCASIDLNESLELLHKAIMAVEGEVLVTFHPVTGQDFRLSLRKNLERLLPVKKLEMVRFLDIPTKDAFPGCRAMIHYTTGAAIMAVCAGLPTICLASEVKLDGDCLPSGATLRASNVEDIVTHLRRLADPQVHAAWSKQALFALKQGLAMPDPEALVKATK